MEGESANGEGPLAGCEPQPKVNCGRAEQGHLLVTDRENPSQLSGLMAAAHSCPAYVHASVGRTETGRQRDLGVESPRRAIPRRMELDDRTTLSAWPGSRRLRFGI